MDIKRFLFILAAALWCVCGRSYGEPAGVHAYDGLTLSSDGDRVASVEYVEDEDATREPHGVIVERAAQSGAITARCDPGNGCRYSDLTFAPHGHALAFIAADRKAKTASLDVLDDGKLRTLAVVKGVADTPRWSPDGQTLAVLVTVGAHKKVGATEAGAPLEGDVDSTEDEQRIAVARVAEPEALRFVSPADTWIYEYAWTPDGNGFAATAARGNGDENWWVAKLVGIELASGKTWVIAAPTFQMNRPRVSPDGKSVEFIGGLMSDFGSIGGDLYRVPYAGGEPIDLTPSFHGSFSDLTWCGGTLFATAQVGGDTQIMTVDAATGAVHEIWSGAVELSAGAGDVAIGAQGRIAAAVAESFTTAPYVCVGPIASMRKVTHDNDALPAHVAVRNVSWNSDNFTVQGWLLSPLKIKPTTLYPMITRVHGGPGATSSRGYVGAGSVRTLVEHGYFVFEPNPRGSFGQGEAFTRANVRDLGGGDLRDILAGIDAVEKIAPVDEHRLGLMGHSYGGFMAMWAVTHTQRFRAAVAGAGICDWMSYYGENGIDRWMPPFFGATAYDSPAIYDRLSPIRYIKNARTPTLIYVGDRDVECPAPQSLEFWHGLRAMGVPVSFVVYAGEGHRIRRPQNVHDCTRRIVEWFDRYLRNG